MKFNPTKERKDRSAKRKKEISLYVWRYKAERGCSRCPEKDPRCLDFHHLGDKSFGISLARQGQYAIQALITEIEKCEVVCSNCHRKEHVSPPSGWSIVPAKDN